MAAGQGWAVSDVVCTSGPADSPFEEKNARIAIAVVVAGSFRYASARGAALLTRGSLLLSGADEVYECSHDHGTGDRCISFSFDPAFLDDCGVDLRRGFPVHRLPESAGLLPLTALAQLALHRPGVVALDEVALQLAGAVVVQLGSHAPVPARTPTRRDERRIADAIEYIEQRFAGSVSLAELAAQSNVNPFHFLRLFKLVTGATPHQFILRRRLHQAALGLRTTDRRVTDVALDVGFDDLSNFNLAFRRTFGVVPSTYRAIRSRPSGSSR